jgi:hypothetical protein
MRKLTAALLGSAALFISTQSIADDSSAALGAGVLVFTKAGGIRMAAEDLYISPKQVRIRFEFANDTGKDIDTIVAFPLPDIDESEFSESALGTVTGDPVNFVGFKTVADGRPVAVQVEQRAFYKGRDVTAILKSVGLPLNIINDDSYKLLDNLSAAGKKVLEKADLAEADGDHMHPNWTVRTKFYWNAHFPAGKSVVIEHSYQPVTGQTFFGDFDLTGKEQAGYYNKTFCLDDATRSALAKKLAAKKADAKASADTGDYLNAYTTDYILSTGNNWKGPIGHFHLTLDKLKPANMLSLCWDGELKKTGATTFEATRENFAPAHDIQLLVLE